MSSDGFRLEGLDQLINQLERVSVDMNAQVSLWLEAMGYELLQEIQNQIIDMKVVDTRRLLNSFGPGGGGGDRIWKFNRGKLILELGTNVEYARALNDGHWTRAKTRWVNGRPYFDLAFEIFQRIFYASLEGKLGDWLEGGS